MKFFTENDILILKRMSKSQLEQLGRKVYKERNTPKIQKLVYYELCKVRDAFLESKGFDSIKEKEIIRNRIWESLGV